MYDVYSLGVYENKNWSDHESMIISSAYVGVHMHGPKKTTNDHYYDHEIRMPHINYFLFYFLLLFSSIHFQKTFSLS